MDDFPFQNDSVPSPTRVEDMPTLGQRERTEEEQEALMLPSFPEQVDAFAKLRNYFRPEDDSETYPVIVAYLASEIGVDEAVARIAEPIEKAYTTADHGRKLADPEKWNTTYEGYSTEGYLWDLYYGILHAARRIPWNTERDQQVHLLNLLKALKARPDPEPSYKTMEIDYDWVLSEDGLWSNLSMMGPSARESWNDCPGGGAGLEEPEIKAWANVNAFIALVTRDNVSNYWTYCLWATKSALERQYKKNENHKLEVCVPAALAWISILGERIYGRVKENTKSAEQIAEPSAEQSTSKRWRWENGDQYDHISEENWNAWKKRFSEVVDDEKLKDETRIAARTAMDEMERLERQAAEAPSKSDNSTPVYEREKGLMMIYR
jgi:Fe-S cluster biosynthesis and repair protein YggX